MHGDGVLRFGLCCAARDRNPEDHYQRRKRAPSAQAAAFRISAEGFQRDHGCVRFADYKDSHIVRSAASRSHEVKIRFRRGGPSFASIFGIVLYCAGDFGYQAAPGVTLSPLLALRQRLTACGLTAVSAALTRKCRDMTYGFASAPARPVARTFATFAAVAVLSAAGVVGAFAQQPQQPAAPKAAPKAPAQKSAPAQKGGAPAPAGTPQAGAPQAGGEQAIPPLIYSNWTKICGKGPEAGAKQVCQTGKDGRLESGQPVVAAVIIEMDGEAKKVLQVTLPPGVLLPRGTRVVIDQDEPSAVVGSFLVCANGGCIAQLEANADIIGKLKKGQNLYVQAYNMAQNVMTLSLPLGDFAKAYDGPPTDPKELEQKNKKLQDELQKRALEARQKLEQQQGKTQ
jgi:invasion protein IalB